MAATSRRVGRPAFAQPDLPLWRALEALGTTANREAKRLRIGSVQRLYYWANGDQWAPLHVVREFERMTAVLPESQRLRLGHWPKVRDKARKQFWEYGQSVDNPWTKSLKRAQAALVKRVPITPTT